MSRTHPHLSRNRGSVLILVVAVLVLLALMGTAYIATSRSDRSASAASESTASVDTLARGVVDTLKTQLVNDRLSTENNLVGTALRNTATAYFSYTNSTSALRTEGLLSLSPRVPVAPGTTSPDNRPRWPFLSSPLDASPSNPGAFANPARNAQIVSSSFGGPTRTLDRAEWGLNEVERRGSNNNVIAAVTLASDGRLYPAFFTVTAGLGQGYVIAADADGDGIADSGLVPLGTLSNPDYAGVTFYYGLRLIDNNSAFNVNTAWTTGNDVAFGSASDSDVRNNRLFPAAIGLKETLTPDGFGNLTKLDEFDSTTDGIDVTSYRAGRLGVANPLLRRGIPVVELNLASGRTNDPVRRFDFRYNTRHELLYFELARRLDYPGLHGAPSGAINAARFTPFTLAEQAQLASGFILAPRDSGDDFATALGKRTSLEQLLPGSLYRLSDSTDASAIRAGSIDLVIRTAPYPASAIGVRRNGAPNSTDWYTDNFNYEPGGGGGPDPVSVLNLRPLLVSQNPVAQSTTFKPLPLSAVLPPDSTYNRMHPYVPVWDSVSNYNHGDVVYLASGATDGRFYRSDFPGRTNVNVDPSSAGNRVVPGTNPTAARPWVIYDGPLVPTKVDVNTASFADLWRGFYLVLASDTIDPTNTAGVYSSNATVSHFGLPELPDGTPDVLAAPLDELYRGMSYDIANGDAIITQPRPNSANPSIQDTYHPQRAFRSNVKDFDTVSATHFTLPPAEMVKLRAAQAAVNAEYLRIANQSFSGAVPDSVIRRKIALRSSRSTTTPDVAATVYSIGRFPYITEVVANNDGYSDTGANPGGYVAIELFNPYPFDISLEGWQLRVVPRAAGTAIPAAGRTTTLLYTFGPGPFATVPAGGYLILENYSALGGADAAGTPSVPAAPATQRPTALTSLPATGDFAPRPQPTPPSTLNALNRGYVAGLEQVFGVARGELVLMRPVDAVISGVPGTQTAILPVGDATAYVPVDSFDFTAFAPVVPFSPPPPDPIILTNYRYARQTDAWRFVYPGRYDGRSATRHQGLIVQTWDVSGGETEPLTGATLGGSTGLNANASSTYNSVFSIQIANVGQGGFRASVTDNNTNTNSFPFGGLPRELDMLQIPFISPVRLRPTTAAPTSEEVFDLISLTQDASFAEDSDTRDDAEENVGRFAPIAVPRPASPPAIAIFTEIDDFSPFVTSHRYGFANRLLEHLTVRSTTRLRTPAVGPTASNTGQLSVANYPDGPINLTIAQPVAAKPQALVAPNAILTPDAGEQGLVNINTAPLPVLAAIPWVRTFNATTDRADNYRIARAIIAHREANGPFKSIFQLNTVMGFRTLNPTDESSLTGMTTPVRGIEPGAAAGTLSAFTSNTDRTNNNGDFSPMQNGSFPGNLNGSPTNLPTSDDNFPGSTSGTTTFSQLANPIGDYESQYLNVIGVSNLITTRSDTFTAYIVIEGWKNAGTSSATRVLQRRYAYILDRTGVAPGLPPQVLNLDTAAQTNAAQQPVVTPSVSGSPLPRPLNTTVRTTEIPVPVGP